MTGGHSLAFSMDHTVRRLRALALTGMTETNWRSASQVLEEDGILIQSTVDPT